MQKQNSGQSSFNTLAQSWKDQSNDISIIQGKGADFNTLAQSWKDQSNDISIIQGKGADFKGKEQQKGKAKLMAQTISLALAQIAEDEKDPVWLRRYRMMFCCLKNLTQHEDRLYGFYCKNRLCPICQAIRKAELINKYLPVLSTWEDAHLLTLTAKACPRRKLSFMMDAFLRAWKLIKDRIRKTKSIKLVGVRSLECNFNPQKKTYNPHFHIIVQTKEMAELIRSEWIRLWNQRPDIKTVFVRASAQDIRKIRSTTKGMLEVIKYGTKVFTDPTMKKRRGRSTDYKVYVRALYNINAAFDGRRLFDRFGFNLPKSIPVKTFQSTSRVVTSFTKFIYSPKYRMWVDPSTNTPLFNYSPEHELEFILDHNLNDVLQ